MMSDSKESGSNSLRDKLKNILSSSSSSKGQSSQNEEDTDDKSLQDPFPDDFWPIVSNKGGTQSARLSKLSQVEKIVVSQSVPKTCLKRLWIETNDLLDLSLSGTGRHAYFKFLVVLIKAQYRNLGMLKLMFYNTMMEQCYTSKEDIANMMLIIDAITEQGKNVYYLEQEVGQQLLERISILHDNPTYLSLLLNVVKFNSTYLEPDMIHQIVVNVCNVCNSATCSDTKFSVLKILDAIVCYNCLLRRSLQSVILTLSNKINDPEVEEEVWKIMRNILGTHLGHSVVQSLLFLLQENSKSYLVLRGAALFIGRGLWDLTKAVPSLTHKPNTVLLFFKKCVPDCHPIVALEILLCCSRLVKKIGHELTKVLGMLFCT